MRALEVLDCMKHGKNDTSRDNGKMETTGLESNINLGYSTGIRNYNEFQKLIISRLSIKKCSRANSVSCRRPLFVIRKCP